MSLETYLAVFRGLEANEDGLVILGDEDACKVLVAWQKTDQLWRHPRSPAPEATHGRMEALWTWIVSGWEIDDAKVARLAGVPFSVTHAKLEMLIGNRLIYPDGSMSGAARKVLTVFMAKKLGFKLSPGDEGDRDDEKDEGRN